MKIIDYHIHSHYSTDGSSGIEEIARVALSKNISDIAITDHFEPLSDDEPYKDFDYEVIHNDLLKIRDKYSAKLRIKQGIELGQPHRYPKLSEEILKNDFDYVIGSAHKGNKNVDVSEHTYREDNLDYYSILYIKELFELAKCNQFDCIGHFDLVKRYAARQGHKINLIKYKEELRTIFQVVIENGKGIEVNTSGLRDKALSTYPSHDILSLYHELGGEIITLGSDAHRATDVGKGLGNAIEMLREIGFTYITIFDKREPIFTPIIYKNKYYNFAI